MSQTRVLTSVPAVMPIPEIRTGWRKRLQTMAEQPVTFSAAARTITLLATIIAATSWLTVKLTQIETKQDERDRAQQLMFAPLIQRLDSQDRDHQDDKSEIRYLRTELQRIENYVMAMTHKTLPWENAK